MRYISGTELGLPPGRGAASDFKAATYERHGFPGNQPESTSAASFRRVTHEAALWRVVEFPYAFSRESQVD